MEQVTHAIIVSPDARTSRYLQDTIGQSDTSVVVTTSRGFEKKVRQSLHRTPHPVLIIVPGDTIPEETQSLCQYCEQQSGLSIIWAQATSRRDETWLMLKLLEMSGATICEDLDTLSMTVNIFRELQIFSQPFSRVAISNPENAVMRHLHQGIAPINASGRDSESPMLKMNRSAQIVLAYCRRTMILNSSPTSICNALKLLAAHSGVRKAALPDPDVHPDEDAIAMIARPPARILSETTSKRLLAAFGLQTPEEMLCDSPSKAVRFAKNLAGPATLKLVRPNFRFKTAAGGVIQNVQGPSEVQKAYQTLLSLAESLGGPRALGILVSRQVESEHRFWIHAQKHNQLGRIIYFGRRDETNEHPDGALSIPCTMQQCRNAIVAAYPWLAGKTVLPFADAVFRFGVMCSTLGNHIGLAQIHPLAITDDGALMIDAVMGITDHPQESQEQTE